MQGPAFGVREAEGMGTEFSVDFFFARFKTIGRFLKGRGEVLFFLGGKGSFFLKVKRNFLIKDYCKYSINHREYLRMVEE